jgi:hypothetical protein
VRRLAWGVLRNGVEFRKGNRRETTLRLYGYCCKKGLFHEAKGFNGRGNLVSKSTELCAHRMSPVSQWVCGYSSQLVWNPLAKSVANVTQSERRNGEPFVVNSLTVHEPNSRKGGGK